MGVSSLPLAQSHQTTLVAASPQGGQSDSSIGLSSSSLCVCEREFMLGLGLLRLSYENKGRLGDETGLSLLENSPKFILLNRVASPALN